MKFQGASNAMKGDTKRPLGELRWHLFLPGIITALLAPLPAPGASTIEFKFPAY